MNKVLIIAVLALVSIGVNAQNVDFGVTAGYLNVRASVKVEDVSVSGSDSGFFVGFIAEFGAGDKFKVQPELVYANVNHSGALFLPVLGKIYLSDKFNLQVGPQFVFSLEESIPDFSSFELDFVGGIGVDVTDKLFVEARYSIQLNNSYTGSQDVTVKGNYLTVGIGRKF
ncbi:MAG: OmpW family protein [Flavobacteriaceae bacterium]|nr:MAG: OmpW family protein [Flavobacteriaceae bacterium]